MIIDTRQDLPEFREYVVRRIQQHLNGPEQSSPVSRIDFGFEFGQQNRASLAFDAREDAEPDGEWVNMLDESDFLQRPSRPIWHQLAENEQVTFINMAGQEVDEMDDPGNLICEIVGEALKRTLLTARDEGLFKPIFKAKKCEMGVENLEGYYGWPHDEERGKENLIQ